jgi:lipoprotein NlpD
MRAILVLVALGLLGACAGSSPQYEGGTHVVRPGDTLYTIAWRHGLDYRDVARWNGLANPDLIFVGQRISLRPRGAVAAASPRSPASAMGSGSAERPRAEASRVSTPRASSPPLDPPPAWHWPTRGTIVSTFGSPDGLRNGIGIAGRLGQPILAAAAGRVVYAGSGLIGYGQLVIVKHNDTYLSAYGHNGALRVAQGQSVAAGEQIAEMGYGPRQQPRLHFEIRRNGSPVDPLLHLRPGGRLGSKP